VDLDQGEDTDEEMTDKAKFRRSLKLPWRFPLWLGFVLFRSGELISRVFIFSLVAAKVRASREFCCCGPPRKSAPWRGHLAHVRLGATVTIRVAGNGVWVCVWQRQAEFLGVIALLLLTGYMGYNHFGRNSPEGWFTCPPEPSWSLDPPVPRHIPSDPQARAQLEQRMEERRTAERRALHYRWLEVARQWTAIWVSFFFYPTFSSENILVLVEERRAPWQVPAHVYIAGRALEYFLYLLWLGLGTTARQQNSWAWVIILYATLVAFIMFGLLLGTLHKFVWRETPVGVEVRGLRAGLSQTCGVVGLK